MSGTLQASIVKDSASATSNLTLDASGNVAVGANLTLSGTTPRITGDFSNATVANRVAFQTSTTNGQTRLTILSNGTSTDNALDLFPNTTGLNTSRFSMRISSTDAAFVSTLEGTGTYLPMTFYTGGSERMRIDTSGNVGIGTASPSQKLQVYTGSATATYGSFGNSANTGGMVIGADTSGWAYAWNTNSAVGVSNSVYGNSSANNTGSALFYTSGSERMRIDSSGNVGIGTNSPSSYGIFSTLGSVSNSASALGAADATVSTILNTSLAAVGNKATQAFNFSYGKSVVAGYYAAFNGAGDIATGLLFGTQLTTAGGTVERMRIDQNGNLLVGTTSSQGKATIQAASTASSGVALFVGDSTLTTLMYIRNDGLIVTGNRATSPYNNTTASAANMYVDTNGVLYRSTSSLRYKENVQDYSNGLADLAKLRPVTFNSKQKESKENPDVHTYAGFIAEEVHDAGLTEFVQYNDQGQPDALAYANMVALLTKSIQELSAKNDALEVRLSQLEVK